MICKRCKNGIYLKENYFYKDRYIIIYKCSVCENIIKLK